jgi:hypothetical protein
MNHQEIKEKSAELSFRDYFFGLPDTSPRVELRERIRTKLAMPQTTLYDKIRNNRFTMAEKILIAELVELPIETLFPED